MTHAWNPIGHQQEDHNFQVKLATWKPISRTDKSTNTNHLHKDTGYLRSTDLFLLLVTFQYHVGKSILFQCYLTNTVKNSAS